LSPGNRAATTSSPNFVDGPETDTSVKRGLAADEVTLTPKVLLEVITTQEGKSFRPPWEIGFDRFDT